MKKYVLGSVSIALAVVLFAFTPVTAKRASCSDSLVWFKLNAGANITDCSHAAVIAQLTAANGTSFDFTNTTQFPQGTATQVLSGELDNCLDADEYICAVGYRISEDLVQLPNGLYQFRTTGGPIVIDCCIYRPEP